MTRTVLLISLTPFKKNNSVTTWKTTHSISSSVNNTPDDNNISSPKNLSADTNISFLQNPPSHNIKMEKPTVCLQRNLKRTEDLKQLLSNTCKNEIQTEMATIHNKMVNFKSSIETSLTDQTKELTNLLKPAQQVNNVISSMYRTSMPSPKHTPKISLSVQNEDTNQYNSLTDIPNNMYKHRDKPYQRCGTLSFIYEIKCTNYAIVTSINISLIYLCNIHIK
jgi:hypothetical protein